MTLPAADLVAGAGVGLAGGFTSGLLGVSPGGGLVVFSVLLLGAEQHAAQGLSLVAQVVPTSLAGVKRYWDEGGRTPLHWLALIAFGFVFGGIAGARLAVDASSAILQWTYVGYLTALNAMLLLRGQWRDREPSSGRDAPAVPWPALLCVGAAAGLSSGFLGIGGGLAITVGLAAWLKVPQRQAQMASLLLSVIPTTLPAAWVYWSEGLSTTRLTMTGVIAGLVIGTDLGARLAHRMKGTVLFIAIVGFVSAMTIYMAYQALAAQGG